VRLLGLLLLSGAAIYGAMTAWPSIAPHVPPRSKPVATAKDLDDCRDRCEQHAIVEQLGEDVLLACRARCGGDGNTAPPRPRAPIRSISVAPARHNPPNVAPRRER
jgi:hypothetical protein